MVQMKQLFGTIARSTSAPAGYDQIDDTSEGRLKVHAEEAFKAGIKFKARFIGSLEIPKPHSRVEIVAAMRRVRYEFKARSTKKKKVEILVSVDGVRVTLRHNKKQKKKDTIQLQELMHDPINRIFYVSHDSSDLNIWSYIARDAKSAAFRCTVFKTRKETATNTVRTIGQAFDVVHRIVEHEKDQNNNEDKEDAVAELASPKKSIKSNKDTPAHCLPDSTSLDSKDSCDSARLVLLRQQVELAEQEMRRESARAKRVEVTLQAEQRARVDAEVRCEQLLRQNKELIGLLNKLVADNPNKGDPFTELAMESLVKFKRDNVEVNQNSSLLFNETPIHMNSTVVKGGAKIDSINATPINDKSVSLLNADELLLSNSSSTLIASERDDQNGDRVLTFNYNPNHHRGRLQSANAMLNSSTLEPKFSPNVKKHDRYEPLRSISAKISPVMMGMSGSKSFGEHLSSGMGHLINKPMAVFTKKMSNNNNANKMDIDSDDNFDEEPLHIS